MKLIISGDGSHTLTSLVTGEPYHSVHGALQESMHVFIDTGLRVCSQKTLQVLEVGLGTGLNALLTALEAASKRIDVQYTALEPYPLAEEIWKQLNYPVLLDNASAHNYFHSIHRAPAGLFMNIHQFFTVLKLKELLEDVELPAEKYDLVYFDAFGPEVQPELWTAIIFEKIFNAICKNGILVTYSAKGLVRRNLLKAGFRVERLPGPPGKREMLRARKP